MSAVLVRRSSSLRPSRKTRSPRSAIFRTSARPIPFVAPSMTARLTSPAKKTDGLGAPNPPVRVVSLPDGEEGIEPRLHRPKMLGPRQRVLCQIDPSARFNDELVHSVDQRLRGVAHRNVQRQGDSGHRERQHHCSFRAAVLDDTEKRTAVARKEVETFVNRLAACRVRQHTLVLCEPSPAVQSRPVPDPIERIKVGVRMDDAGVTAGGVPLIRQRIEHPYSERRQGHIGKVGRHRHLPLRRRFIRGRFRCLGPAPAKEHAAPHRGTARQAIDPSDRHRPARRGRLQRVDELVHARDPPPFLIDPGRRHFRQPEGRFEDWTRESHAANRGAEQVVVFRRGARDDAPVADTNLERYDVLAEAPIAVMVLAVDIRGNHPADGHEPRSRGYWRKEAARQKHAADVIERQARFGGKQARLLIEREDPIGQARSGYLQIAWRGQSRIAIRPAETARERQVSGELLEVLRADFDTGDYWEPAPAGQDGRFHSIEECRTGDPVYRNGLAPFLRSTGTAWRRSSGLPERLGAVPQAYKEKGCFIAEAAFCVINPGSDLLSHTPAHAVPSAVAGLTSVFGMGTGVTLPL